MLGDPHDAVQSHTYTVPSSNNLIVVDLIEGAHTDFAAGTRLVTVDPDTPAIAGSRTTTITARSTSPPSGRPPSWRGRTCW